MAVKHKVSLIMYGENGEVEYGGTTETSKNPIYDVNYMIKIYLESGFKKVISSSGLNDNELFFFKFPKDEELKNSPVDITHWSYFENFVNYNHYLVAKEHCGLLEKKERNNAL